MTYAEDAARYRDGEFRDRASMCIREQGYIFAGDGRPDIAALGRGVVGGESVDIDAVLASVVTNGDNLDEDQGLLSAVQMVWPTVAAALYGDESAPAEDV